MLQKGFLVQRRNNCVTWLRIILVHVSVVNDLFPDNNHRCGYEWIARITAKRLTGGSSHVSTEAVLCLSHSDTHSLVVGTGFSIGRDSFA